MKRSEFTEIVNTTAQKELEQFNAVIQATHTGSKSDFSEMITKIVVSIPAIAAKTTAEILVRSGVLSLEDD